MGLPLRYGRHAQPGPYGTTDGTMATSAGTAAGAGSNQGVVVSLAPRNGCKLTRRFGADEKRDWHYVRVYPGRMLALAPHEQIGELVEHAGQWWLEVWYDWHKPIVFRR